jgi:hypothetical protein
MSLLKLHSSWRTACVKQETRFRLHLPGNSDRSLSAQQDSYELRVKGWGTLGGPPATRHGWVHESITPFLTGCDRFVCPPLRIPGGRASNRIPYQLFLFPDTAGARG